MLTRHELLNSKNSDTLAILGSGASINTLTHTEVCKIFKSFDTFALNWYCKNPLLKPKYYLVDEQGVNSYKAIPGFMPSDFIKSAKMKIAIVKQRDRDESWKWELNWRLLNANSVVIIKRYGAKNEPVENLKKIDFYNDGATNLNSCVAPAVHFAIWMAYKRIIFYGIDLYDSRYSWGANPIVAMENRGSESRHPQADNIIGLVKKASENYPEIIWRVHNKKSLLTSVIETYDA
jgi:hypothetical protein